MAVTFTAVAEPDKARVAVEAKGGVPGESFYLVRRDEEGSSLVRETSESAIVWKADPAGTRTNYIPDPSFEKFSAMKQTAFSNLVLNPTCKANTAAAGTTVRKNYATNPSLETTTNGWSGEFGGGSGTRGLGFNQPFSGLGYIQQTWGTASTSPQGGVYSQGFAVTAGQEYMFSAYVRTSIRQLMHVQIDWRNSASQIFTQTIGTAGAATVQPFVQPDAEGKGGNTGWTRVWVRGVVPANAVNATTCVFSYGNGGAVNWPAGSWLQVDGLLIERTAALNDYFDGSSGGYKGPEGDLAPYWEGAIDGSMSQLVQYGVQNISGRVSQPISSMGGTAVAVGKPVTAGQLASALVETAPLVIGGIYTFSAVVHVPKAQTGTLHANARRIGVETGTATALSGAVPNVPGSYPVSVTFTATSTTEHRFALYNGSDNDVVSFSNLQVTRTPVAMPFFHSGSDNSIRTSADVEWQFGGTATTHDAKYDQVSGAGGSNAIVASSTAWTRRGGRSLRVIPNTASNASYAQIVLFGLAPGTYTALGHCFVPKAQTGSLNANARSLNVVAGSGTTITGTTSVAAPNTAGAVTEVRFTFTVAGSGNVNVRLHNGAAANGGDVFWDDVAIINGNYTDFYFDGGTHGADYSGWNGAANASASYYNFSSLAVTIFDYEARQGITTTYLLADDAGTQIGENTVTLVVPAWGTWVKDPFRPWMNTRVYWNSDGDFEHSAERTLLLPRGSRYPVALYGRRLAPSSTVVLLTETKDQRDRLLSLLDTTGVVQLDVDSRFGVPMKYVSVGDFKVSRTGSNDRNLTHDSRFFTLPVDEVARPTGAPKNQAITYDSLLGVFSSYLEIPSAVKTYDELTEGSWNSDV